MAEVYLKIYVKEVPDWEVGIPDDGIGKAVVLEGCGNEEKDGYYPFGHNDKIFRLANIVVGEEHMLISKEAKEGIKYICEHSKNYNDYSPWFDIDEWWGGKPDAMYDMNWRSEHEPQVRITYGSSSYIDLLSLVRVTTCIGHYRCKPMLELLDRIPLADNSELAAGYEEARHKMLYDGVSEEELEKSRRRVEAWAKGDGND